ncbi:sulfotransferase domain-containing protein [Rhodobacter sp. JA431]|uniref:sulfotransferase family protein n=1 Tax=Rhodobacter sp. JA431 TaxID=570013 RepID=UPI000BD7BF06|nr:sulfotransferase [Rhodobacter sp. JA431]SOB99906.1 sulfotransferase domain-containing protein [Rhodobacter sp. JA431]
MTDPRLPNFLIIGAGKCGTTSLWSYLNQHPQIGMSAIKEPSFFSQDDVFRRGLDWYRKLYTGKEGRRVRGEASNSYSATESYPQTIERIAATLGHPKLIYITRHPAARTESDWMQRSNFTVVPFAEFIRNDPLHADKNMYLRCYERYAARFGAENILVLFYEDLRKDPSTVLSKICTFLGVDEHFAFDTDTRHGQSARGRKFMYGLGKLRELELYMDLSLMLPDSVKSRLREALSTTQEISRPVWSTEDQAYFRARYEASSRAFLERVGRAPNLWAWEG